MNDDYDLEQQIEDGWARYAQTAPGAARVYRNDAEPEHTADDDGRIDFAADESERIDLEVERVIAWEGAESDQPVAPTETEAPVSEAPEPPISAWTLLFNPKAAAQQRIDGLGRAIERSPNAASNYVLRGELLLKLRRYDDAENDFRRALELAAADVENRDWGVVAQVVQDRALAGLRRTRR